MATNFPASEDQTILPLGNANSTVNSLRLTGNSTAANAAAREFVSSFEFQSNHGYQANPSNPDLYGKVTSYRSFIAGAGSADAWVDNALLRHETNDEINTHIAELDYDMISTRQYGTTVGGMGLAGPSAWGMAVTGISTQGGTITGAYLAASQTALFQRGYVSAVGVIQSGFEDDSAARVAFRDCGSHIHGLDTTGANYSGFAVNIRAGQKIGAQTASNALIPLMMLDTSGNLLLGTDGTASAANVITKSSILPLNDNNIQLGGGGARFSSVWAANGTIQTSDPALKREMNPIDGAVALRLVAAVKPITFRWVVGGYETARRTERREVPVMEVVTVPTAEAEVVNGEARVRENTMQVERPVYDEVPVVDQDGMPIMHVSGRHQTPRLHRLPRVELRDVEVEYLEPRAGQRLHWGWNADEIAAAFRAENVDFGGYIEGEDGNKALRPDQLLPVLWSAVRELQAHVNKLESRLAER